ncbi:MAG: hypothetical protein D6687_09385 [Acidobacteria bacterium]|nr:MAG: hypothetical protein D6687_09385 [Acidobacteriota bacterium]
MPIPGSATEPLSNPLQAVWAHPRRLRRHPDQQTRPPKPPIEAAHRCANYDLCGADCAGGDSAMMAPYICVHANARVYYLNVNNIQYVEVRGKSVYVRYNGEGLRFDLDDAAHNTLMAQFNLRSSATIVSYSLEVGDDD